MNLNQVTVPVLNVARAVDFYKKMGLRLIVHTGPHYARFECPAGDATFSVHEVQVLPKGDGAWIYFEWNSAEELDQYVQGLIEKGIAVDGMPEDQGWLWREARLKDPDGNQLILFHAGENRKNPPWKLSTKTPS